VTPPGAFFSPRGRSLDEPFEPPADFPARLAALGLELSPPTLEAMGRFLRLLEAGNERMNLTAVRDRAEAWDRHVLDSLTVLPGLAEAEPGEAVADLGSGGGLPGLPLAIARPDLRFTLIESTGKKARFLEQTVEALELENVSVLSLRCEEAGRLPGHRRRYGFVVCRAIGAMVRVLEWGLPLLQVGGTLLAMKGPSFRAELDVCGDALTTLGGGEVDVVEAYPETFGRGTVIVIVQKLAPTPEPYPRPPGSAKQGWS
jgi:16S rRNA (guanine527-N7)-methyltransferase